MTQNYQVYLRLKTFVDSLIKFRTHLFIFHPLCFNCNCSTLFPSQHLLTQLIDEVYNLEEIFWLNFWYDPGNPSRPCFDSCIQLFFDVKELIISSICNHVTCNHCMHYFNTTVLLYDDVFKCFTKK